MSKYDTDLDYVIIDIDISREELKEIKVEADKIISENKESKENLAIAYLKKAQCLRKLNATHNYGLIFYDETGSTFLKRERIGIKKHLEKALELLPNMPEALMQLGLLNSPGWLSDKYDKAIIFFNRAIQLKPDYAAAFNNRAMIFYGSEDICKLLSISDDPKDKERFEVEEVKINFKNAIVDLTEAIKIRPFDAIYYLNRGIFHSKLGEHKESVEDLSNTINYASDKVKDRLLKEGLLIFNLRGKEYTEIKDYGKAIDDFSETLRLHPSYNEKLTLEPNYDETLLLRGKAYYLSGEKDKAKADFDEYKKRKHKDVDTDIQRKFLNLFRDIDIDKEISFFSDYIIRKISKEEFDKLPTFEEYLKNLETDKQDN